jgi:hypothetical protein
MSLNLSGIFRMAIGFYSTSITIQDTVYTVSSGEDVQALSGSARTVYGAVDSSSRQTMEFLFGGDVSDGDVMVYVSSADAIYIADMYASGATRKQSFMLDGGVYYRIASKADWSGICGFNVYLAKRHVKQGVL